MYNIMHLYVIFMKPNNNAILPIGLAINGLLNSWYLWYIFR